MQKSQRESEYFSFPPIGKRVILRGMKKKSFVSGALILGAAGIICKLIGVFIRIWAYDAIGVEGMVYYEAVFPFYSWLLILSSSGIPSAISRMVAEREARRDYASARQVLRRSLLILSVLGLITTGLMFFGAPWISKAFIGKDESFILPFRALAPALFFVSAMCAYRGYLQGMQQMSGTAVSQIVEQVGKAAVGLYLAKRWIDRGPVWGASGILVGIAVSELLALLVVVGLRWKNRRQYFPVGAELLPQSKERVGLTLAKIAIPITLGASIIPFTSMLDVRMIFSQLGQYMDPAAVDRHYVALNSNVRSLINLPSALTQSLAISIIPAIAAAAAKKDSLGVKRSVNLSIKLSLAIGFPCAIGLFVLGGPIIKLLFRSITPESLEIATRIMRYASVTVIFISLVQTVTGALQGLGKQNWPVYCLLAGGVVKIISNYLLLSVPSINIVAASISNVLCYGVAGVLDAYLLLRLCKMRLSWMESVIKPLTASLLMGGCTYLLYSLLHYLRPGDFITLCGVFFAIAVYMLLLLLFRVFNREDFKSIPAGMRLYRLQVKLTGKE